MKDLKDALTNILTLCIQNSTFLAQVSADVSALKTVISALGPEARAALEEQLTVERDRIQKRLQELQIFGELLRSKISNMVN
jgi:predicted transcriptional regulator